MLTKIKEALDSPNKIREISAAIDNHNKSVAGMQEQLQRLQEAVTALAVAQEKAIAGVQQTLAETEKGVKNIEALRKQMEEEVYQFRVLKGQLQSKLVEKFDNELKAELRRGTDELHTHSENYSRIKEEVNRFAATLSQTAGEIQKWLMISKSVQEKDFDMTKTSRQLITYGEEKKALHDKIEMLEKLVGKMRRQTR